MTFKSTVCFVSLCAGLAACSGRGEEHKKTLKEQGPACKSSTLGRVTVPSPLISVGLRVTASEGVTTPEAAVDGRYHSGPAAKLPAPSTDAPAWLAVEVGAGPERLLLIWTDAGYTPYNVLSGGAPTSYSIETSSDSSDGSDGTWENVVAVEENPVRSRGHSIPFAGKSWVRFVVTGVDTEANVQNALIDELALHDITESGSDRPSDTWLFMGDSITQGGLQREFGADAVDQRVHAANPDFFPAMINAGIGGEFTSNGNEHLATWLELNPDFSHVAIAYGTNDSWSNKNPDTEGFREELETLVTGVLDAGRVPVLTTIPYASMAHDTLPAWNDVIREVRDEHDLPCGADLYAWFESHPDDLSSDGVHPNSQGYRNLNAVWADTILGSYPNP